MSHVKGSFCQKFVIFFGIQLAAKRFSAHEDLASDKSKTTTDDATERTKLVQAYWQQPQVWPDIDKVFKLILERAPTNLAKSEYAYYAVKCKKWDVAEWHIVKDDAHVQCVGAESPKAA